MLSGRLDADAGQVQVPRHVGQLRAEDLLEVGARVPGGWQRAEGTVPQGGVGRPVEHGQRAAGAVRRAKRLRAESPVTLPQGQEEAQTDQKRGAGPVAGPGLLPEVAQLLRARRQRRLPRHRGPPVQSNQPRDGQLLVVVLRTRLQRGQAETGGEVQLQVPVVLLRHLRKLHYTGVGDSVQLTVTSSVPIALSLSSRHSGRSVISVSPGAGSGVEYTKTTESTSIFRHAAAISEPDFEVDPRLPQIVFLESRIGTIAAFWKTYNSHLTYTKLAQNFVPLF